MASKQCLGAPGKIVKGGRQAGKKGRRAGARKQMAHKAATQLCQAQKNAEKMARQDLAETLPR